MKVSTRTHRLNTGHNSDIRSNSGATPVLTIGNTALFPRHLVGSLAILTCGVFVAVARSNSAQQAPVPTKAGDAQQARASAKPTRRSVQVAQTNSGTTAPTVEPAQTTEDGRRPVEFYTQAVRGGLFSAPQPPAPKLEPAPKKKPEPIKVDEPIVVEETNPFDEWSYAGLITSDKEKIVVLENRTTKEGRFLKVGDEMLGCRLDDIDGNIITFKGGKKPWYVAKSQNINVTPLNQSAVPVSTQQPAQGAAPVQTGQIAQMPVMSNFNPQDSGGNSRFSNWRSMMMNGGAGGTFTLPNGMQLNADQFQRRSQRMNRNFNN